MKKILALAIAVIMICACAFTVSAAETTLPDVDSPAFWGAHSEGIEITAEGVDISFLSTSYAEAASNWEGPMYILYTADEAKVNAAGYVEYWVQRGDNWGWIGATNTGDMAAVNALGITMESTCADWDALWANYVANCKAGCEVKIHAQLVEGKAVITMELQTLKIVTSVPVAADKPAYLSLSGEKAKLTNIKVTTSDPVPAVEQLTFETAPVDGTAYKLGVTQVNANKVIYLSGVMDGYYFGTTENIDEAADVYVENVEGGFKMYILVEGAKQYINIYTSGKYTNVEFSAENAKVFAYNAECKNLVTNVDGTDFYLGCYKEFTTISASKTSYITAENTCVSQFPAGLVAVEVPGGDEGGSDETGDMIGIVIALLAVSGMGITVLKKK